MMLPVTLVSRWQVWLGLGLGLALGWVACDYLRAQPAKAALAAYHRDQAAAVAEIARNTAQEISARERRAVVLQGALEESVDEVRRRTADERAAARLRAAAAAPGGGVSAPGATAAWADQPAGGAAVSGDLAGLGRIGEVPPPADLERAWAELALAREQAARLMTGYRAVHQLPPPQPP
jgi:hypothetical protein